MGVATAIRTIRALRGRPGAHLNRAAAGRLAALLGIFWLLAASMPRLPLPLPTGVDGAWYYALNLIHRDGGRIGPDITFTMGPLGYLTVPDPEITPWWQPLLLRTTAWVGLAWGVLRLARAWPLWAAFGASAVLASTALLAVHYPDSWQASYLAALLACAAAPSAGAYAVAGGLVGLTLLLKANEALLALALYVAVVAAHRRVLPKGGLWLLALPVGVLLAGAWAVNGGMGTVLPYLLWALEVVRGFTEAASVTGPLWQLGLFLLFWAAFFSLALMDSGLSCLRHPFFWCALLHAFQSFKHGMVRQDGHADLALLKLAAGAFFLLILMREQVLQKILVLTAVVACCFTWVYIAEVRQVHFRRACLSLAPGGLVAGARNLASYKVRYQETGAVARELRSGLTLGEPYHSLIGSASIDAFPDQIDWIRANQWNYRARPTLDAVTVFTARMNQRNARHFAGPRAPEFMLFFYQTVDARHPLIQDTGTVRALLERYEVVHEGPRALLLKRLEQPRPTGFRPVGETVAGWEEPFTAPAAGAGETIWAGFDIVPSPWGRLRWFIFRTDPPLIQVDFAGGESFWFRLQREIVSEPVPVSPLPRNLSETALYLRNQPLPSGAQVARLMLRTAGREQYIPLVRVRWYAATR